MIITDVFGCKREQCPRCGGAWIIGLIFMGGDGCEIVLPNNSCLELFENWGGINGPYFYNLSIKFGNEFCSLSWGWNAERRSIFTSQTDRIYFPMLPYDITIDRLKTLLVFS